MSEPKPKLHHQLYFLLIASTKDCKSLLLFSVVEKKRVPKATYKTRPCAFIKSDNSDVSDGNSSDSTGPIGY